MKRAALDTARSRLLDIARAQSIPGFCAAIVRDEEPIWACAEGVTALDAPRPVDLDTRFPLASVTKTFTAAAFLAEAARKPRALDTPLATLWPDLAWRDPRAHAITPRLLLSHRAGLADYDPIAWADAPEHDDLALERAARSAAHELLLEAPGGPHRYCNAGYDVLGALLARWSGTSFERAVHARVLEPLGMRRSGFQPELAIDVRGHVGDGAGRAVPYLGASFNRAHAPGGTLVASARELARLVGALASPRSARAPMLRVLADDLSPTGRDDGASYGFGVRARRRGGELVLGHGGWDPGFRCAFAAIPSRGVGALVLTNFHWSSPAMLEVLLDVIQDRAPTIPDDALAALRRVPPEGRGT